MGEAEHDFVWALSTSHEPAYLRIVFTLEVLRDVGDLPRSLRGPPKMST